MDAGRRHDKCKFTDETINKTISLGCFFLTPALTQLKKKIMA